MQRIKLVDINSKNMRIKVVAGKGNKDRYTLLSSFALTTVRQYFLNPINNIISLVSGFS